MGEEVTNPIVPETYKSRSFNEVKLKELYGENPSASQQKKFNKYLQSEQGQLDKFNFDKEESDKVFTAAEARMKARTDFYQKQRDAERAQFEQAAAAQAVVTPVNTNDDNKPVDTTKQWSQHMTQLGYTPMTLSDGSTAFKNNNIVYYNNGRMMQNGKMSNYNYTTLSSAKPQQTQTRVIASEVANHNIPELKGRKNEYPTEAALENEFASLYNQHVLNGKYKILPQTVHKIRNQIKQEAGYGEAWQAFRNKYEKTGNWFTRSYVYKNKQGGTMNKIKYFRQGGQPTAQAEQQNMQQQVIALVQAAMQGDQKATQTVNKIMEEAKAGNQQAMQIAQMIQAEVQKMQGKATTAKWGAKLGYIKSLKYAHGGKTCPACDKDSKVKVAYKDIDKETYKKLPTKTQLAASMHAEHNASEYNKNGTYKTVHKPTAEDSTMIDKKHLSVNMKKKYTDKKECGGKAKKRYFGGWL